MECIYTVYRHTSTPRKSGTRMKWMKWMKKNTCAPFRWSDNGVEDLLCEDHQVPSVLVDVLRRLQPEKANSTLYNTIYNNTLLSRKRDICVQRSKQLPGHHREAPSISKNKIEMRHKLQRMRDCWHENYFWNLSSWMNILLRFRDSFFPLVASFRGHLARVFRPKKWARGPPKVATKRGKNWLRKVTKIFMVELLVRAIYCAIFAMTDNCPPRLCIRIHWDNPLEVTYRAGSTS